MVYDGGLGDNLWHLGNVGNTAGERKQSESQTHSTGGQPVELSDSQAGEDGRRERESGEKHVDGRE